ncbi:MAG: 50S ribosomal protein L5 [Candidatus Magasanikbacteria bacterium]|jgi:large subunit ribosomal protein L5|nr:50S ribosomal protein L5 [Candidatus Magasanikbacteria bacterium]MBT4220797.1 50S ribosomal protein L5 [Candidatus Magasanikbacteria bacterium]MBT4350142.1 50S ribosomal protein L5 [Candidatus Magasanikbacteria bacterium]MBT4541415.1 50S ribosomal protein L5 [Candidatus Magasanikbacteria bacterium]MBT6253145.1 50S ribosomal protein L5 [Candidatus Magasanikbacteria bacterium]
MEPVLYTQYKEKIVPALKEHFGFTNVMQVPKIEKIVVNVGYGRNHKNKGFIDNAEKTLIAITGQKPVHNKSRKAISNFKIREGVPVGVSVTLRGKVMYEFLYRFINLTLPRMRDFRGLNGKAFDKSGNYSIGIKENIAFPEITADSSDKIHGLQVVIKTTATNKDEGRALLDSLGFPFKKK